MIDEVVQILERSKRVLVITGAGVSADSGLPTYRGVGGLYDDKTTDEGVAIEEALSGPMFSARPELTWKYIAQIAKACQGATFNRAHQVIAEMETKFQKVLVFTQNIDGFHRAAGSTDVIDIHGDIYDLFCIECRYRERVDSFDHLEIPPRCLDCGGLIRPDVVLFGEAIPMEKLSRLQTELSHGFDAILSIGTTAVFPYIVAPVIHGKRAGVPTIEINPGTTTVSEIVDIRLEMGAAKAMGAIWEKLG